MANDVLREFNSFGDTRLADVADISPPKGPMSSGFLGMFIPRRTPIPAAETKKIFQGATGVDVNFVCETPGFFVVFSIGTSTHVTTDVRAQTTLLLHGEVITTHGNQKKATAELIMLYLRDGLPALAKSIHGSCVVLIIDSKKNVVACITDRVNSRKVFFSRDNNAIWLSTSLQLHPTRKIDPAGVASYVINRFIYNGRTVFDGVSVLDRSTIHTLQPKGVSSEAYWTYDFETSYQRAVRNEEEMVAQLADLLHQAVLRRLPRQQGIALCSLSGGIDCRMILGLLMHHLQDSSRLKALSYGFESDDDVKVAKQITAKLGISHRCVSFSGDLAETIRLNGQLCEGLVFFYTQGLAGIEQLRQHNSADNEYFVGDECFGWGNMSLSSFEDVLQKGIGIRAPARVPAYYSYGICRHGEIEENLRHDIEILRNRCPPCANWHDCKDFLYLDQRLANMILPWREFHAARFIKVNNPWLDNDILDFMKSIPTPYRLDKLLFRKTMTRVNPELSRIPYAKGGGINNVRIHSLLQSQFTTIIELISSYESKLDDVIPPDLIKVCLLDLVQRQRLSGLTMPSFIRDVVERIRRKYLAVRWYLGDGFVNTGTRERYGVMAISPVQLEALIALRYFLRIDK